MSSRRPPPSFVRAQAEVGRLDQRALRHQHRALDRVIELADVAGPAVLEQHLHRAALEPGEALPVALRVLAEEVLREQRQILAAIAQRRQPDLDRVQPEQQVLPEPAGRRPRRSASALVAEMIRVSTRRVRDDPQPLELAGLDDAQQLGLLAHRHVGDFVEEQRALVRQLEAADAIALGVGERAADVAEQLALEDPFRHAARVHDHHRPGSPARHGVQRPRDDPLAGAVLPEDQDVRVGRADARDDLQDALHRARTRR